MSGVLIFDCETTGKADFHAPPEAPHQPRIVQLCAMLTDGMGKEISCLHTLIKPDGWTIPAEATAVHGITTEMAEAFGIDESAALHVFDKMLGLADRAVAHNLNFDRFMVSRGNLIRRHIIDARGFCTMRATTPLCKLPGNYGDYKWPKLQEAYRHFFGTDFDGAHDALSDVRACARIYFAINQEIANEAF